MPRLAHTIHLVVRDALKGPQSIINKVKEAVEYFHRSTVGAQKTEGNTAPNEDGRTTTPTGLCHKMELIIDILTCCRVSSPTRTPLSPPWPSPMQLSALYLQKNGLHCRRYALLKPFEEVTLLNSESAERYVL